MADWGVTNKPDKILMNSHYSATHFILLDVDLKSGRDHVDVSLDLKSRTSLKTQIKVISIMKK